MREQGGCVYILASKRHGTLYVGVTSNLKNRVDDHKNKRHSGFTAKYGVAMLVYYETHPTIQSAIRREKQIKAWHRQWKINLIEQRNPQWRDLFGELV